MLKSMVLLVCLGLGGSCCLAQEAVPYTPDEPGYHVGTLELARFCLQSNLISQGRALRAEVLKGSKDDTERQAAEKLAQDFDLAKPDVYTAKVWGDYLDRREALQARRAESAWQALGKAGARHALSHDPGHAEARKAYGHEFLEGVGWLEPKEAQRLRPFVASIKDAPKDNPRKATWLEPYVVVGEHFTLVSDLPWWRVLRYVRLLDRYYEVFFEIAGEFIPKRKSINLIWCCAKADDFIALSKTVEFPMTAEHEGAYLRWHGYSIINAQRADEVGKLNKAKDNLARTLFHECTHRLAEIGICGRTTAMEAWGNYMEAHGWIVEAIAVIFENLDIKDKGYTLASLEAQRTHCLGRMKRAGTAPQLATLFKQNTSEFGASQPYAVADKYAVAGSIAWYCLFAKKDSYRAAFFGLLIDQYRSDSSARTFEQRFGQSLEDFENGWKAYALGK